MSARISIDLEDSPAATIEVAAGINPASVWVKIWDGQAHHSLWLTPAQALSAYHGLGDVLMALNIATIEAAGLEAEPVSA